MDEEQPNCCTKELSLSRDIDSSNRLLLRSWFRFHMSQPSGIIDSAQHRANLQPRPVMADEGEDAETEIDPKRKVEK